VAANLTLEIKMQSPFRVGSGLGFAWKLDHLAVRDARGLPYIPGSTLKGLLRHACQRLALTLARDSYGKICQTMEHVRPCLPGEEPCIICRLFGSRFREGSLKFGDALLSPAEAERLLQERLAAPRPPGTGPGESRTQVKLSRIRRVAEPELLFCGEVLPEGLTFIAKVKGELDACGEELLRNGARLLTHLGAQKNRGLGYCRVSVSRP